MSSILKVDTIQDQDGNNIINESGNVITIGASGDTITVPAGATVSGFTSAGIDDNATSTAITISSGEDVTFTENILLGDNKKAKFGTGNDLEIYHDGSNSIISDTGTGSIKILSGSAFYIRTPADASMIEAFNGTSVDLYYNNSKKFETTSDGATVTGTAKISSASSGVTPNANADELFVEGSGNSGITIGSGTSGAGQLCFGDSGDNDTGALAYLHDVNAMRFTTGGTERVRIDANGNLMVGKTSVDTSTSGVEFRSDGLVGASRASNPPLLLNRRTDDGNVVLIRKDNSNVGFIGVKSSNVFMSSNTSNDTGFKINPNAITPSTYTGTDRDNAIDLGSSSARYKDLYLSSGAFLGGTGSANKLDDFEIGTFIPTLTPSTSGSITISNSENELRYTKIGTTAFIQGRLTITSSSSPVGVSITLGNMPFTPVSSSEGSGRFGGMCAVSFNGSSTFEPFCVWTTGSVVKITTTTASINSNTRIHFNFFYETA